MESIQLSKENNIVAVGRVASSSNALPRKTYITYEVASIHPSGKHLSFIGSKRTLLSKKIHQELLLFFP